MKKAILVGINKYIGLPGADLQGCVNDVTNMRDILLKYFGFAVEGIRVLTDARATKQGITDRLNWLVKGSTAGDVLLFHYSGHGSQIRDRNGDELKDGMDEMICPTDMTWDNGNFIIDDELAAIVKQAHPGAKVTVILDSCHSGTMLKNNPFENPGPYRKARYLAPPVDIRMRSEGVEDDLRKKPPMRSIVLSGIDNAVLFAGCRDNQTSADAEINGSYNGALTYYLCKHLRDTQGHIARSKLVVNVRNSLRYNGYDQVPQLEGKLNQRALTFIGE